MVEREPIAISKVGINDLGVLLPLMRAYCDFYEVAPRDDRLVSLCRGLIDDPGEGVQLIARDDGASLSASRRSSGPARPSRRPGSG